MYGTLATILLAGAPMALANAPGPASDKFEGCSVQLEQAGPNTTHSLFDIVNSTKIEELNDGEPSELLPIIQMASAETQQIIQSWDIEGDGYTLMLPANMGKNYTSPQPQEVSLLEQYPELESLTPAQADAVIRAHIIPETLDYNTLLEKTQAAGSSGYTAESLQGFSWTWKFIEEGDGYLSLVDTVNATESSDGLLLTENDLSVYDACPNRVYMVEGFMATYDLLEEDEEDEEDAPTPIPALPEPEPETAQSATPPPPAVDSGASSSTALHLWLALSGALAALLI